MTDMSWKNILMNYVCCCFMANCVELISEADVKSKKHISDIHQDSKPSVLDV